MTAMGGRGALVLAVLMVAVLAFPACAERFPASPDVQTLGAVDVTERSATLRGQSVNATDLTVWFEFGTKSNSYGYTSPQSVVEADEIFEYEIKHLPLIPRQTYYYRAACTTGYGDEENFTLLNTSALPTTSYGDAAYRFVDSVDPEPEEEGELTDVIAESTWAPYTSVFGSAFFAMVIGTVYLNLALKGRSVAVPAILVLVVGTALWGLFPPEFLMVAQTLVVMAIAGIVYWIMTKRKI